MASETGLWIRQMDNYMLDECAANSYESESYVTND
jgi:hypothetical protein